MNPHFSLPHIPNWEFFFKQILLILLPLLTIAIQATGSRDNLIHIWSTESDKIVGTFKQHRDAVSGLAFRKSSNQLYSASFDRSVKVWNVDELSYIETL